MQIKNSKEEKISRGYRLKPSTHKKLADIQDKLKTDIDTVISLACKKLTKEMNSKKILVQLVQ